MATASFPPSDETIDNFIGFVGPGLDRNRVVRILQYHNNDVEQAINAYFDNPDSSKYDQQNQNWDEGVFNSNRDGSNNNTGISFSIQAADELPPLLAYEGASAPSRPPSRTSNNRSPHNAVPSISKPYDSNNDPELAEALRASLLPQESGITSTDEVSFGPANRSQYEQGKWDLIPVSTSTREILLDPEPEDRRRDLGAPAFLKPSTDDNRLAALLTIYHEIPMMREMFLDRTNVAASYGNDREWWTGKAIDGSTMMGGLEEDTAAFVHELQRLMAFLDKTDRSYGSAEALANLPFVKSFCRPDNDLETAVLDAYRTVFSSDNPGKIKRIFSRGVEGPEQQNSQEFAILQLTLPRKDSHAETIYDVADKALWDSTSIDLNSSPYLSHIGDIITFRFTGGDETRKNGVIIPAVWYPDRYMHSGRQAALDMRLKKRKLEADLTRKDALETSLTYHELRSGKRIKVQDMFKTALRHELDEIEDTSEVFRENEGSMLSSKRSINSQNLSEELHKLADRIDRKLIALSEERNKAKAELKELSKLYTKQSEDLDQPTLHRYTLRGVSTSKNTMYICRQAEPDLIDMDLGSEDSEANHDQWWKIYYAASEAKPVNLEKVTEEKVLEAASESNTAMLVYASEKAMTSTQYILPTPLDTFVRKDNVWFKHEFPPSISPISSPKSPTSPGKRKVDTSELSDEDLQERRYRSTLKVSDRDEDSGESEPQIPSGNSLEVTELNGNANQELLIGIDPTLHETPPFPSQEMQERGGMRLLSPMPMNGAEILRPIDIMDLDQVMEDDNIAQESGAVKHVGFMD